MQTEANALFAPRQGRILVVDDAPANIQAVTAILREHGYQISVATNGRQALSVLERVLPDLILMDVLMPVTRTKKSAEWIQILNDAGVPCGPIYRINESFADPQVQHLGMAAPVRSPALGDITILAHPVTAGGRRAAIRSAAPELGQDNEEILTALTI